MDEQLALRHKALGISSFVLSLVGLVFFFAILGAAAYFRVSHSETEVTKLIVGLLMIVWFIVALVGIGLGIAGARDKGSEKVFPILGIIINVGAVVLFADLMVLGLQMEK